MTEGIWPEVLQGDAREVLRTLAAESVHCVVTSPPYWGLRDYGVSGQIGLEESPEAHVSALCEVFDEVWRVLRRDGTLWLNYGDCYNAQPGQRKATDQPGDKQQTNAGSVAVGSRFYGALKPKDLLGMPWRVAFALQAAGWWVRSAITICKNNPMPESVTDRPTSATEMLFLLTKQATYFYDHDAIREPHVRLWQENNGGSWAHASRTDEEALTRGKAGVHRGSGYPLPNPAGRNKRNWWLINSQPLKDAHFATFPEALVEPCILAGTSEAGCCPECGAGWRRVVEKAYRSPPQYKQTAETTLTEGRNRNVTRLGDGVSVQTTGWAPSCAHTYPESALAPAVVLDPFAGSGTVGKVATQLGRKSILIDLNPTYLEIIAKRNAQGGLGL